MKKIRWDIVLGVVGVAFLVIFGIISFNNYQLERKALIVRNNLNSLKIVENVDKKVDKTEKYVSPYEKIFNSNVDMCAWLYIPDTNIDYPVMQTLDDEEYYLYRDFYGNDDKNGTLFVDTDCSLDDENANIIIHGHHMKSGEMFGSLEKYLDEEYGQAHSTIYLYTRDEVREYEVISVFTSKVYNEDTDQFLYYNYFRFDNEETFDEYYSNIKKMSVYDTGVEAEYGDEFLTLSTCSYHTKDGRLAVIARKNNG